MRFVDGQRAVLAGVMAAGEVIGQFELPLGADVTVAEAPEHLGAGVLLRWQMRDPEDGRSAELFLPQGFADQLAGLLVRRDEKRAVAIKELEEAAIAYVGTYSGGGEYETAGLRDALRAFNTLGVADDELDLLPFSLSRRER